MAVFYTYSAEETIELGERLGRLLQGGQIVAFTGGMGMGKTTMCRGISAGLGCVDEVASPTFAIVNVYRGKTEFAHFDAFRLTHPDDLEAAGLYDYMQNGAVVAVEWSEQVIEWLPPPDVFVNIEAPSEDVRKITIQGEGLVMQ